MVLDRFQECGNRFQFHLYSVMKLRGPQKELFGPMRTWTAMPPPTQAKREARPDEAQAMAKAQRTSSLRLPSPGALHTALLCCVEQGRRVTGD